MPTGPVVKILRKKFPLSSLDDEEMTVDFNEEREESGCPVGFWEDGVTDHEEEDVGWMYMPVVEYFEYYNDLCDADHWYECYVRPPLTFYGRNIEDAVGCWRTTARTGLVVVKLLYPFAGKAFQPLKIMYPSWPANSLCKSA
ncbi:hypothetical protein F4821DRAFT_250102 [Hypoxylon rubiginosum]|uniref:Uncharacterized protein n=1 Tax=Hypoxylon rubiginosum TaxID=110542 RepID=A0ACC0CL39_9PEZI|nr:hypothetical protein F4821DRAFT_250102 [Hypoxylon rubiginosum]